MTLWDLYAVKKYLIEQKIRNYNEDDIFDAYEKLYEIEDNVESMHKSHLKKYKNKSKKIKEMVAKNKEELNDKYSEIDTEGTDDLYKDIQIYDITEK